MKMASSTSIAGAQTGTPPVVPLTGTVISDVESSGALTRMDASWVSDIEHVHVNDDPRAWSPKLKVSRLYVIAPWSPSRSHHLHRPMTTRTFVRSVSVRTNRRAYCAWPSLHLWLLASVAAYLIVRKILHVPHLRPLAFSY